MKLAMRGDSCNSIQPSYLISAFGFSVFPIIPKPNAGHIIDTESLTPNPDTRTSTDATKELNPQHVIRLPWHGVDFASLAHGRVPQTRGFHYGLGLIGFGI